VNYKSRPGAKDFIQVEILVEKNSQKIILIGKVRDSGFVDVNFGSLMVAWHFLF